MSLRIENRICHFDTEDLHARLPASAVTVITDAARRCRRSTSKAGASTSPKRKPTH